MMALRCECRLDRWVEEVLAQLRQLSATFGELMRQLCAGLSYMREQSIHTGISSPGTSLASAR